MMPSHAHAGPHGWARALWRRTGLETPPRAGRTCAGPSRFEKKPGSQQSQLFTLWAFIPGCKDLCWMHYMSNRASDSGVLTGACVCCSSLPPECNSQLWLIVYIGHFTIINNKWCQPQSILEGGMAGISFIGADICAPSFCP